jgi:hypothetical protein
MSSGAYHVFGAGRPVLLGRQKEIDQIRRLWGKQHISIVAPKYYGKSVLMEHIHEMASEESGFSGAGFWDVRKNSAKDDAAFWRKLYYCLKNQIEASHEYLPKDENTADAETMLDTFRFLESDQQRILLLWDGVDELLLKGGLSDNLWNQLTALADFKSVTLILSSRRRLMDLLPTEEAKGSDFWRRFALIIPLGCFQQSDWPSLLAPIAAEGGELDPSAQKELVNWSGGVPLLTAALLNTIQTRVKGKCVLTKAEVDGAAGEVDSRCIEMTWRDLDSELQNEFAEICRKDAAGGVPRSELDVPRLAEMESRGLVLQSGHKFRSAVRLLAQHAVLVTNPMPNLRGLFGTSDKFISNAQSLLELRLAQVASLDADLKYHLSQILKSLDHPNTAMELMRGVFDRTASLVLKHDFPDGKLPPAWVAEWESKGAAYLNRNDPQQRNRDFFEFRVPSSRANRKHLYSKLLSGDKPKPRTRLRAATIELMDFIYEAANYGEHAAEVGEEVPMSFAISVCSAAVELCHHLVEDLNTGKPVDSAASK